MLEIYKQILNSNQTSKNKIIENLKSISSNIIIFTENLYSKNEYIRKLFNAKYFQGIFCKIYFFNAYSFYAENNFINSLKKINEFNEISKKYEINNKFLFINIIKLKADVFFKLEQYKDAIIEYHSAVNFVKEKGNVLFNMGISYIMLKQIKSAKELLEMASEKFKLENNSQMITRVKIILNNLDSSN